MDRDTSIGRPIMPTRAAEREAFDGLAFASLYFSRMSIPVWKNAQKEKKRNRSDVSDPNEPAIDSIHGSDAVGARDEERNLR